MEADTVLTDLEETTIELTERDIQFDCEHCDNILIVDRDGAGLELACPHCGEAVIVPEFVERPSAPEETLRVPEFDFSALDIEEIKERGRQAQGRLKENQSQRTEIQSYINKATIDLHRWQLQMKKLNAKMHEMKAEIEALQKALLTKEEA